MQHVVFDEIVFKTSRKLTILLLFNVNFPIFVRLTPSPILPVRRRRVIESVLLHVQRKYARSNEDFV
jgi:hypothetical protein